MPEIAHRGLYAASVNPPRRAKRPPVPTSEESSSPEPPSLQTHHRAILPMRPYTPRPATIVPERAATPPPPPAKRGRKPGPLSRSAREAQRRLNHSIIEKARRTKINDALATLKQLVPPDYGRQKRNPTDSRDEEDEDEDDEEYEEDNKKGKPKVKGTGKKEEKEKEFKLEILVRTVSFLQDLLVRVESLEANVANPCSNCGARPSQQPKKRKRNALEDEPKDDRHNTGPDAKAPRLSDSSATDTRTADTAVTGVPNSVRKQTESPNPALDTGSARLPSISSWLPNSNSVIDPQLLSGQTAPQRPSPPVGSYLPSPPSSTHFDPVRASTVPPLLNLGPVATAAMVSSSSNTLSSSSSVRTPEDESAASLLLQISASSPTFRPINSSAAATSNYSLKDPSNFFLHSEGRTQRGEGHVRHAQTPSSLLGMKAAERKH